MLLLYFKKGIVFYKTKEILVGSTIPSLLTQTDFLCVFLCFALEKLQNFRYYCAKECPERFEFYAVGESN